MCAPGATLAEMTTSISTGARCNTPIGDTALVVEDRSQS